MRPMRGSERPTARDPLADRLLIAARVGVLVLAAVRAWASRHANNPAGLAYLDIADAYASGNLQDAINAYWSPLYSLALAIVLRVARPSAYWEATAVHVANFAIFALALAAFDRFLRVCIDRSTREPGAIPVWAWVAFGYAAFAWSSLEWIGVADVSADLLMAVFVYAAAAILASMQAGAVTLGSGLAFGLWLGLGYLAKAAMFPLAFVFLGAALMARRDWRRNLPVVATALLVFLLVSLPFVIALSLQKERVTVGDTGKLVYAWFVNDVTKYAHWQGEAPARGAPLHPDRQIHENPDVFAYPTPVAGTHPAWYDPSYWYEGLETHFDPRRQVRALLMNAEVYWIMLVEAGPELLALAVLLAWSGGAAAFRIVGQAVLLLPALASFALFALVHAEPRFVGAFAVMVLLGVLQAVPPGERHEYRRLVGVVLAVAAMFMGLRVIVTTAADAVARSGDRHFDHEIATGLAAMGLEPGDAVGVLGAGAYDAYWARLAGVRVLADMPEGEVVVFWSQTAETRQSVYDAFRQVGVRYLVTFWAPSAPSAEGWEPIGATGRLARRLDALRSD